MDIGKYSRSKLFGLGGDLDDLSRYVSIFSGESQQQNSFAFVYNNVQLLFNPQYYFALMESALNIMIVAAAFFFMEFAAWFTHKYIMHGVMWYFHKDHHQTEPGFFEKNDAFFLIFAVPSWLLIMFGMMGGNDWRLYTGLGILLYGLCYFLVHDVLIHKRFKWFKNVRHPYLKALIKAHYEHHKHKGKEDGESFGMLVVSYRYIKEAYARRKKKNAPA